MMTPPQARTIARQLAGCALEGDEAAWGAGASMLAGLDGRSWLLVDHGARSSSYTDGAAVSGTRGWLATTLAEPSGLVAAVTSFHVDGRLRERALGMLGAVPAPLAAPALAVRLLDHVPQIRARAWDVLQQHLVPGNADLVLDVLLAAPGKKHAAAALDDTTAALLGAVTAESLLAQLTRSDRPRVRRWAFVFGHHHDLFTPEQLVAAARDDPDQWVRTMCAEWLMQAPDPGVLVPLLDARSVEARLVALTRVPGTSLSDDALGALLVDRARRVREQARWRARRRAWDVAGFYRRVLSADDASPRVVVAALEGLLGSGEEGDVGVATSRLGHASGRVRAAAVTAVGARVTATGAIDLLAPSLLDPVARVSAAAARALVRVGAPAALADQAWGSPVSTCRRAAWRLARGAGGWHRVEADLRAAADVDLGLAALGRTGIANWLEVSAATTWAPLPEDQRARIAQWLDRAKLDERHRRLLAFHAGLHHVDPPPDPSSDTTETAPVLRGRLLRLVRRT